jgi:hypothetical protein
MNSRKLLPALVVVVALLTSCRGVGDGTAASSATPHDVESPAASSTPDPPGTEPQLRRPSGPYDLVLERVRVTERDGGERVVLDFAGKGRAGWSVQYVDQAVLEGSGDVVDIDGEAILQIGIFGTPTQPPESRTPVPIEIASEVAGDVADVHVVGAYEGITTVFVGIEGGRVPFAIEARRGPSRMVVDLGGGVTS